MTRFEKDGRYRHRDTLDIDMQVVEVLKRSPLGTKLSVLYFNRHWKKGEFLIDYRPEIVVVKSEDYAHWERIR